MPMMHDAVAGHQHVAALDGGQAPGLLGIAPPDRRSDEVGVELVDRLHQQRLVVPGRPVQRIERQPAVDPAGGVAGVERVGQRRHQVLGDAVRPRGPARGSPTAVRRAGRGSTCRRSAVRPAVAVAASRGTRGCRRRGRGRPRWRTILRSSSQALASGIVHRLGEQVVQLDDLDAAVAHLVHEVEVVAPGVLHPQHVVEQQVVAVGRASAARAPGPASTPAPCAACRPRSARRSRRTGFGHVSCLSVRAQISMAPGCQRHHAGDGAERR